MAPSLSPHICKTGQGQGHSRMHVVRTWAQGMPAAGAQQGHGSPLLLEQLQV